VWKKAEDWGTVHPVALTIFSLIVGLLLGGIPAGFVLYNSGFYEGVQTSDATWRKNFDNHLKMAVDEQIVEKCGEVTRQLNVSCQSDKKSLEAIITEKSEENAELHERNQYLTQRSDIIDTHATLTGSASAILDELTTARAKRERDLEAKARSRFFALLSAIHRTNEIYTDWAGLFNSRATDLVQRYDNKENISTDEIIDYLQQFTSDLDAKKKVMQDQVNEANKIKNNKF